MNESGSTSPSRRPRQQPLRASQKQQQQQQQQRTALNELKNQGNALPQSPNHVHTGDGDGTDNKLCAMKSTTPLFLGKTDLPHSLTSSSAPIPSPSPVEHAPAIAPTPTPAPAPSSQLNKRRGNPTAQPRSTSNPFALKTSPLKRSDEAMDLDDDEDDIVSSPSPKRRSVEGPISSLTPPISSTKNLDFTVFDAENRDSTHGFAGLSTNAPNAKPLSRHIAPSFPQSPATSSTIPKRSSSLRKSTLQQRQSDRPFSLFAPRNLDSLADHDDTYDSNARTHTRASSRTCNAAPADNQSSSSQSNIDASTIASLSPIQQHQHQRLSHLQSHQQQTSNTSSHPLSRALTQSSSEESLLDDSPSHEPVRNNDLDKKARPILNFSKSLPAGSIRPIFDFAELQPRGTLHPQHAPFAEATTTTTTTSSSTAVAAVAGSNASFATPINYRLVKPLPAAFMSTGLISKKNKNAEDIALAGAKNMPDTPCKRSIFPLLSASTSSAAGHATAVNTGAGGGTVAANGSGSGSVPGNATIIAGGKRKMNRSALGQSVMCANQSGTSESTGLDYDDNDNDNDNDDDEGEGGVDKVANGGIPATAMSNNGLSRSAGHKNESATMGTATKAMPHPGPFSKGMGIFGSSFVKSRMMRRSSSSGSIDGDISQVSPSARYGVKSPRNSLGVGFPPTPTKTFTPVNGNANRNVNGDGATIGTVGSSSIFSTAPTSRYFKPSSSKRLLLQEGLAQSPLRSSSYHGAADDAGDDSVNGVKTPGGLTCKFSSCSSLSSPTSGETVSESDCESDDELDIDVDIDDGDEDGDTIMDGSPSLLGMHHLRRHRLSRHHHHHRRHLHQHHHRRFAHQDPGLPCSLSSRRIPRFSHDSARSPSPQDKKNIPSQHHKLLHNTISLSSSSFPPLPSSSSPSSFYTPFSHFDTVVTVDHTAKHEFLHPTASPLDGKTSLFRQSTTVPPAAAPNQTASMVNISREESRFGTQASTPHTPLENHVPTPNFADRLSESRNHDASATPGGAAATTTRAANCTSGSTGNFDGNVASAGSTRSHSIFGDHFPAPTPIGAAAGDFPATPTGPRESFVALGTGVVPGTVDINAFKRASLQKNSHEKVDIDECLMSRFDKVEIIGIGEFSQVFMCINRLESENAEMKSTAMEGVISTPNADVTTTPFQSPSMAVTSHMFATTGVAAGHNEKIWAVKKSKQPISGARDRERRAKEVEALRKMKGYEHLIRFEDSWEENGYLYIQTEFCEEGSLQGFLGLNGLKGRLDDFRTWKIMLELAEGLKHIHNSGYIHLDLKPANVLITGNGILKIADFGLATPWPAEPGIDGEGDREYIGPEILMGRYDKPADIFALGLIIFETAGNVELPDNGPAWQKLRNGDLSDVVCLSWRDEENGPTHRDERGNPIPRGFPLSPMTKSARTRELAEPPEFMINPAHESSFDSVVRWLISPDPDHRPTAQQVLEVSGARWVAQRRRAGATIYEGNWGPADERQMSGYDEEMIDV
ncbi:hypothetical protein KEM54_002074 [Ascosphaera aggregata]|nr:hypothetical protein KEM54_002074 [Ascosphaera aggregata]